MKYELQLVISGKSTVKYGENIQAATCYLKRSERASPMAQDFKHFKKQETEILKVFINENNFWVLDINIDN